MKKIKVLNLYAGIGGNRKLWENVEVTAIENNKSIAKAYKIFSPEDKVIVADAHEYLLEHYKEFDFIWSSPPCPTHSRMMRINTGTGSRKTPLVYPDMRLYQEIILLTEWFKGKWIVENVISYYDPLKKPIKIGRHYFWSNINLSNLKEVKNTLNIKTGKRDIGLDISNMKFTHRKDQIMNNCVEPKFGLHIFNCAFKNKQQTLN